MRMLIVTPPCVKSFDRFLNFHDTWNSLHVECLLWGWHWLLLYLFFPYSSTCNLWFLCCTPSVLTWELPTRLVLLYILSVDNYISQTPLSAVFLFTHCSCQVLVQDWDDRTQRECVNMVLTWVNRCVKFCRQLIICLTETMSLTDFHFSEALTWNHCWHFC